MSATSRRTFLSGAAATAAATLTTGCDRFCPAPPPAPVTPDPVAAVAPPVDQAVAFDFIGAPRFLDPGLAGQPHVASLLYGLLAVDVAGQELLLPNTAGLAAEDVMPHEARIWVLANNVTGGVAPDGTATDASGVSLAYWKINGLALTLTPTDAGGNALAHLTSTLARRNAGEHPWTDMKWVRNISVVTGQPMLAAGSRDNTALVSSRLDMTGGTVTAMPPFSAIGRDAEWKVQPLTGGSPITSATTDAMLWHRALPASTAGVKLIFRNIGTTTTTREVKIKTPGGALKTAITHATQTPMASTGMLKDTKAFAQLLQGGIVATYPFATAARNFPPVPLASGSDVHCECGAN